MEKFIIGLAGQASCGKDTVAAILIPLLNKISKYNFVQSSFSYNVKKIFSETFHVNTDFIEEWKRKPECPSGFNLNVRQSLQQIGDGFRKIKSDVWIEAVLHNPTTDLVISDVRYCNEAIKISKMNGINIIMLRPGHENNDLNDSEKIIGQIAAEFRSKNYDGELVYDEIYPMFNYFLVNDGSLEDLRKKVQDLLLPYLIKKMSENSI